MLEFLKNEANKTYTENGAVTFRTSGRDCLDLFATIGALRRESDDEITERFLRAYAENPDLAMKILFYGRDVRGGLGERRVFRTLLRWLAANEPKSVIRNLPYIAEYGRWDDVLVLLDTPCRKDALALLKKQFEADLAAVNGEGEVSLLAKWLPSVNASNADTVRLAKLLVKGFGMAERDYRKALTRLRARIRILENNLREKDYTFDYSKQPSKAMFKYRRAFERNDGERYHAFMERVTKGQEKLNTGTLFPYEIIEKAYDWNGEDRLSLDATWRALPDFTQDENALVVADGSGSMYWPDRPKPAAVAQSLAIYFAERNHGMFHNHFITFSMNPKLVEIKGRDIVDKARYCASFNECANTNIQKVFELILDTAVKNRVPQKEMPSTLYIISDMEFDSCAYGADVTNFKYAAELFRKAGYTLPKVVFWNVCSRSQQQPVTMNEQGVALVSGNSPRIFSMVIEGSLDPFAFMLSVINTERYAPIAA